ncbi:MAG: S8 family serine peptidase, partial [Actinomycetota bacterium]|nr:S8 family serine peptidase [Actinomycetota bacterium]
NDNREAAGGAGTGARFFATKGTPAGAGTAGPELGSPKAVAEMIGAGAAHRAGLTGRGVDVALIDSGIVPVAGLDDPARVVNGPDLSLDSQNDALRHLDGFGHGTHMAGLIAGRDTGVAPGARLVNVKVGAADGSVDVSQVIAAIDWVVQHRNDNGMNIRVLNLSLGTDADQPYTLDPLAHAAETAWRAGIVVVAAGGNDGRSVNRLANPASDPFVLAVGATDPNGTVATSDDAAASFSTKGNPRRHVDVLAPGKSVLSLRAPGSFADTVSPGARVGDRLFRGTGTSQAAAITSGAAALLLEQRPTLGPDQVKALLTSTATPVKGSRLMTGGGTINVERALAAPASDARQAFAPSTGTGSLEGARGSSHLVEPATGAQLVGEQDIMGRPWDGERWAAAATAGSSWSGGTWNGSSWSGSSWSGSSWSGSSWSGSSWSGSSWSGSSWSGSSWSGSSWSGSSWSGSSWSGSSWSGSSWSGSSWSGSSWSGSSWS